MKEFAALPEAKKLFAVDINSKFEVMPGVKNMELLQKFIADLA